MTEEEQEIRDLVDRLEAKGIHIMNVNPMVMPEKLKATVSPTDIFGAVTAGLIAGLIDLDTDQYPLWKESMEETLVDQSDEGRLFRLSEPNVEERTKESIYIVQKLTEFAIEIQKKNTECMAKFNSG